MKLRNFIKKHIYSITTFALTMVATGLSSRICYFVLYQPEVPANLKDFSRNR